MSSRIVVHRSEADEIEKIGGWVLIFGRRKVGKTYLVRNFLHYDTYFFVHADRSIRIERGGKEKRLDDFREMVDMARKDLKNSKTVVIDEFQRLPMDVWEEIASVHPSGRLILSGSSMRVVSRIVSRESPLLGLLYPYRLGLIRPRDIMKSLFRHVDPDEAVELAPYLRDPWTIPLFRSSKDFFQSLVNIVQYAVPALIGEIFTEEEREMTKTYRSIVSLIGAGYTRYEEVASILYNRGIVKTPTSASVLPYIKNLRDMGVLKEIKVYGKKKYRYLIESEPANLYYYLSSRYDLSREVQYGEIEPTVKRLKSFAVERFIADLFAEIYDARVEELKETDREIDIFLTKRNKPYLVGEVKWGRIKKEDIRNFIQKVDRFGCEKVIFSKFKPRGNIPGDIRILTPEDLKALVD